MRAVGSPSSPLRLPASTGSYFMVTNAFGKQWGQNTGLKLCNTGRIDDPNPTMCIIPRFEKYVFITSEPERSKTVRKIPENAPEQRTYPSYNISKAQHQRTTDGKVRAILRWTFFVDTHGSISQAGSRVNTGMNSMDTGTLVTWTSSSVPLKFY